jgi:hypothetical protein
MESQELRARFRQTYGEEYADFLTADWGPAPHFCPYCGTETLRKLLIGEPPAKADESVAVKWYKWCERCLRGIYCPPGSYRVRAGVAYVRKGDEEAIREALPAGLKLIKVMVRSAAEAEDQGV